MTETGRYRNRWRWICCFPPDPPPINQLAILHTEANPDEDSIDLRPQTSRPVPTAKVEHQFDDSMFFFDAAQDSLDLTAMLELYPIMTTSTLPTKKHVSLDDPNSMLGHDFDGTVFHDAKSYRNLVLEQSQRRLSMSMGESNQWERTSPVAKSHVRPRIMTRIKSQFLTSTRQRQLLQEPRIQIHERGFPGSLSPDELEACVSTFIWACLYQSFGY